MVAESVLSPFVASDGENLAVQDWPQYAGLSLLNDLANILDSTRTRMPASTPLILLEHSLGGWWLRGLYRWHCAAPGKQCTAKIIARGVT